MMGPLRFWPILKEDVWGGRRLEALGKHLDGRRQVAESWEIADLGADQSVVVAGPHAGHTVRHLVRRHRSALLGPRAAVDQFPLLLKLLDAKRPLSVQVHPNGGAGKSEAWVVLEAEPGAVLYAGLRPDVTPASLRQALVDGRIADCLHAVHPRVGDVVFLPAGTVHALGAGLVVAELQPTSDITYRLYDWDRAGADGRRRALHVEEALACIHWDRGPVPVLDPVSLGVGRERLVACDAFTLERWTLDEPTVVGGGADCAVVLVVDGTVTLAGDPVDRPVERGDSALIPAVARSVEVRPVGRATVLVGTPV